MKDVGEQFSRYPGRFVYLTESVDEVAAMDSVREAVDSTQLGSAGNAFAWDWGFLNYEQYARIGSEALRNIGLSFVMILVVVALLLGNVVASVLTVLCVVSVVVEMVGFLYFWGLTIDSVVVVFVVISLGLSVDYCAHIAHGYLYS